MVPPPGPVSSVVNLESTEDVILAFLLKRDQTRQMDRQTVGTEKQFWAEETTACNVCIKSSWIKMVLLLIMSAGVAQATKQKSQVEKKEKTKKKQMMSYLRLG